ncbi:hypothetical protein ACFL6U_30825, partial [Planctomycetota bacterium]
MSIHQRTLVDNRSFSWVVGFCSVLSLANLLCASQPYEPQTSDPILEPWRWYPIEELSGRGFQCMAQEPNGVMWFGLQDGILRYDGLNWLRFGAQDGLKSTVKDILITHDGRIVVQTAQAIYVYSYKAGWIPLINAPYLGSPGQSMAEDEEGIIWAGCQQGLIRVSGSEAELYESLEGGITTVFIDTDRQLWLVPTDFSIVQVGRLQQGRLPALSQRQVHVLYTTPRGRQGCITQTQDGCVWIASDGPDDPVHIYDPRLERWTTRDLGTSQGRYTCSAMTQTQDGTLWLIGQGKLHAMKDDNWKVYKSPDVKLPSSRATLMETQDGSLWMGELNSQVYRIDYSNRRYVTYRDLNFQCETPGGQWWFLHRSGSVVVYDPKPDQWRQFTEEEILIDTAVVLLASRDGTLWAAGSHHGEAAVSHYDGIQWQREVFPDLSLTIGYCSAYETQQGDILFGSGSESGWDPNRQGGGPMIIMCMYTFAFDS